MDKHQENEERDDDRLLKNASMDDIDDVGDDAGEDDEQEGGGTSGLINGGTKAAKGIANVAKKSIKAVGNIIKVISKLPPQVQVVIYSILLGIIVALVVNAIKTEANDEVNTSVNTTVSSMTAKLEDESIPQVEKDKIQKAVDHFEKENSYLYFRISDINDAYENYKKEYENSTNDVASLAYPSLSTEYGTTELDDTTSTSRLVDTDQKQPLFKHLLMTEKYNFNKVKWKWFGHHDPSNNGVDLPTANFRQDKELGIRYPNDHNSTELETFIKLLSPYMQTWHIPLATHSAFLTKSGSSDTASKFTYSVIKNTYSDIVVHRYDIQKYILNTKYDDYMRREKRSKITQKIFVKEKYVPQVENYTYEIEVYDAIDQPYTSVISLSNEEQPNPIILEKVSEYIGDNNYYSAVLKDNGYINAEATFSNIPAAGSYYAVKYEGYVNDKIILKKYQYGCGYTSEGMLSLTQIGTSTEYIDYTIEEIADDWIEANVANLITTLNLENLFVGIYNTDNKTLLKEDTFSTINEAGYYPSMNCIYRTVNRDQNTYTINVVSYPVDVQIADIVYKTDASGKVYYDVTCSYEYLTDDNTYEQILLSERYDNTRKLGDPLTVDKASDSVPIDPMEEDYVSEQINIKNKYYIKEAKTFDVKFANAFNYTKYEDDDTTNRVNAKSEKETGVVKYFKTEPENVYDNKIDETNISSYVGDSTTLRQLNEIFDMQFDDFLSHNSKIYGKLRDAVPGQVVSFVEARTSSGENITEENYNTTYTNIYKAKNTYVEKEGLPENNQGTHYITRMWEDSLTQSSAKKDLYTVEDLVEFNASYNSKLNSSDVSVEKTEYQKILDKDYDSKSNYNALELDKKLNNIYFINSNSNIFEEYMVDETPNGPTTGYNNEWLKLALDEVKNLFSETADETGKIPYVYGISLGLTNLLEDTTKQQLNSGSGIFGWPTDNPYISAIQGDSEKYGYGNNGHTGVDIWGYYDENNSTADYWDEKNHDYSVPGPPIYAIADGTVIKAEDLGIVSNGELTNTNPLGNNIYIKHDNGYISSYGHLYTGTFKVNIGDTVKRGQEIASMGSSGNSSCVHVHFNIYDNSNGDDTWVGDSKLDPLEFYSVEPTELNVNKIEYDQLLQDASLRNQISRFNMYKYVGSAGTGDIIQEGEPLPSLSEDKKQELLSNLASNGKFYSDELAEKGCWLLEYYRENSIELLARVMNCEINSAPETEAGIYLISAQLKATMNGLESRKNFSGQGKAENIYELIQSGYFSPYNLGEGDLFYQEPPQFYRKLAAAALDGVLPNPPGFNGNEKQWTGSSDKMSNGQIQTNYNSLNTVGYAVSSSSWHVFTLNSVSDPGGVKLVKYDSPTSYLKLNEAYGESVSGIEGVYSATPLTSNISKFEEVLARY